MGNDTPRDQGFEMAEPEAITDYRYITRVAKVDCGEFSADLAAGADLAKTMEEVAEAMKVCGDVLVDTAGHGHGHACDLDPDHDGHHHGHQVDLCWFDDCTLRQVMRDRPARFLSEKEEEEAVRRYGTKHEGGWLCFRHPGLTGDLDSTDGIVLAASREVCGVNGGNEKGCQVRRPTPDCPECGYGSFDGEHCDDCGHEPSMCSACLTARGDHALSEVKLRQEVATGTVGATCAGCAVA